MRTWIILDVSFLAHRAFHTTGRLSYNAEPTGIAFGVLRDIRTLAVDLGGDDFVFAFDFPPGLREGSYSFYKQRRRTRRLSDDEEAARNQLQYQINKLKTDYLPALGYGNVFASKGFEADDVIASVAANLPDGDLAVVVSADKDLYQLLSGGVSLYNPITRHRYTTEEFQEEWGIHPTRWPEVKAIAGCDTDEIPGVAQVGEKTAIEYLKAGDLKNRNRSAAIRGFVGTPQHEINLELVTLPYPNCPRFVPVSDPPRSVAAWNSLCERLGMKTLVDGGHQREAVRARKIIKSGG